MQVTTTDLKVQGFKPFTLSIDVISEEEALILRAIFNNTSGRATAEEALQKTSRTYRNKINAEKIKDISNKLYEKLENKTSMYI